MPARYANRRYCLETRNMLLREAEAHVENERKKAEIIPRWERYERSKFRVTETDGLTRLNVLIQTLDLLDTKGFKRSKAQREFHKHYISACLKKILREDLHRNIVKVMDMFNIKEIRSDVIVTTPRRHGKTMSVALFVAAYIYSQPECDVSIYSTGRRASRKLLILIRKIAIAITGSDDCILTFNEEVLKIKGKWGGTGTCSSYPSQVKIDQTIFQNRLSFINV